jgi:hypothetical protein
MTRLEKLVEEIDKAQKMASYDLEGCDYRTRAGMTIAVREAEARLAEFKKEYTQRVLKTTLGIFVEGDGGEEFGRLAQEESATPLLVIDVRELYHKLASGIYPTLGPSREFGPTQMGKLLFALDDLVRQLGLDGFKAPPFVDSGQMDSLEATTEHVMKLVRLVLGDRLNVAYISREIAHRALELRYSNNVLPVVFIGIHEEDDTSAFEAMVGRFGYRVQASSPAEVTSEMVLESFKKCKRERKKDTQPPNQTNQSTDKNDHSNNNTTKEQQ